MINIPNLLTIFRLVAAVLVGVLPSDFWILVFFVTASLTDWLDGHLARKWEQTTALGAMLDPIADKAIVLIALLRLALELPPSADMWWFAIPAVMIIFREVFVSGMREYLGNDRGTIKVSNLAKWKTAAQMFALSVLFLAPVIGDAFGAFWWGGLALLWLAAILSWWTGFEYLQKTLMFLRKG